MFVFGRKTETAPVSTRNLNFELRSVMHCRYLLLLRPGDKDRKVMFHMTRESSHWTRTLLARSFILGTARTLGKILEMLFSIAALSGQV